MLSKKVIKNNEKRADKALSLIEGNKGKILELGTGNGEFFSKLTKKGFEVTGIDIYPHKNLLKKGFKIKKHNLNEGLPFKDNSFNVIVALEILEHLFNPYKMMEEIRRVLKPGGYTIISMPNTECVFAIIGQLYHKRMENLDIYWHHYQPNIISIRNLIKTQLKIEKEISTLSFSRLRGFDWLGKFLLRIDKYRFSDDFIVKARKI